MENFKVVENVEEVLYQRIKEQFDEWANGPTTSWEYRAFFNNELYFAEVNEDPSFGVRDFIMAAGATKGCLIYNDLPYVFKFNLHDTAYNIDYCGEEVMNYKNIVKEHPELADMFVKTEFLGNFYGHDIYYSEKVKVDSGKVFRTGNDYRNSLRSCTDPEDMPLERGLDTREVAAFYAVIDSYGLETAEKFYDICDSYEINDLGTHNFGYREDGKICVFDYSGYHGIASYDDCNWLDEYYHCADVY